MALKKSRKIHLRKFNIKGRKILYSKWVSMCNTADIETYTGKEFKSYMEKFPYEVCKKCLIKFQEMQKEISEIKKKDAK